MKNRIIILITALSLMIILVGCKQDENTSLSKDKLQITGKVNENTDEKDGVIFTREDEDRLVKINIKDGEASIYFDLDRWDELHNIYDGGLDFFDTAKLQEGPFPIIVKSGKVKDACIGKIQLMDYSQYEFTMPTVVLMMEDGSLEWFFADPYMTEDLSKMGGEYENYQNFRSHGKLAHMDNFSSFFYESDGEGIGDNKSIYITNEIGDKFDFYYLWLETMLYDGVWICELFSPRGEDGYPVNGYFSFERDGSFNFNVGIGNSYEPEHVEYIEYWVGNAEMITKTDRSYPLGTIVYDLHVDWWVDECVEGDCESEKLREISGSYRSFIGSDAGLTLCYNDGDDLYQQNKDLKTFNLYIYFYYEI
ncbi:MAG: hypothetical protein ACOX0L_06595 [Natronincolaceae bacterium]